MKDADELMRFIKGAPSPPGYRKALLFSCGRLAETVFEDVPDLHAKLRGHLTNDGTPLGMFVLKDCQFGRHLFPEFENDERAQNVIDATIKSVICARDGAGAKAVCGASDE